MRDQITDNGALLYFPRRLGRPVHGNSKGEPQSWEERSEAAAFAELRRGDSGLQVILGEPGAGKTRLLEEWFQRWWTGAPQSLALGTRVPMLVRLRQLKDAGDAYLSPDRLADQLWSLLERDAHLLTPTMGHLYRPERVRLFRPVWLLDGLDELPVDKLPLGEALAEWLRAFAMLPGDVVTTCRTAVWQAEQSLAGGTGAWRVETVMPLGSEADRAAFLRPSPNTVSLSLPAC